MELILVNGSVVYSNCDVIVNAANEMLLGGSGVCGAILQAAGWNELQNECNAIGGCKTGHAVMTNGYNLKAKKIIHAVGPKDGNHNKLKSAFYNSLVLADSNGFKTIGMVPISSGIYGFPLDQCADIAIKVILNYKAKSLQTCYMYCYTSNEYDEFCNALKKYNNFQFE